MKCRICSVKLMINALNPIAHRKAKIACDFDLSESNRVKYVKTYLYYRDSNTAKQFMN